MVELCFTTCSRGLLVTGGGKTSLLPPMTTWSASGLLCPPVDRRDGRVRLLGSGREGKIPSSSCLHLRFKNVFQFAKTSFPRFQSNRHSYCILRPTSFCGRLPLFRPLCLPLSSFFINDCVKG